MATTAADLLLAIAEPTRLRIVNCLAAAPLFVSDLQAILELPQPTVSRHLATLRQQGVVHDTPVSQFVLYRLRGGSGTTGKLLRDIIEAMRQDPAYRGERERAAARSRTHTRTRLTDT